MRFLVLFVFSLIAAASAHIDAQTSYHEVIGIPAATRIKAQEDAIIARLSNENRIVGGAVAPAHAYPYLGGLVITFVNHGGTSACGSSLVSTNRLVTAAHCWRDTLYQANQFIVVLGSQFLFSGGTRIATSQVITHPMWTPSTLQNDVAVIYLPTHIFPTQTIQPVTLPHSNLWDTFDGWWAIAAGYGKTSDSQTGVSVNSVVSHVSLQVISVAQCQAVFGWWAQPSNICTNGFGGVGICGGDSGGPLVINLNGQHVLVGISSFVAAAGCQLGHPSAFARVTSFYSFIVQNL